MTRRNEHPIRRTNPSGKEVWVARYTGRDGKTKSAGTFDRKRDAQEAIDSAYLRSASGLTPQTVGGYLPIWLREHPRSDRTDKTNAHRVTRVLDVELDGRALRDYEFTELKRRHATFLIHHMLTEQKRAARGAAGIIRSLSAMTEDAMHDEIAEYNPFKGARVRMADPRVTKPPCEPAVWTFAQMHAFAACGRSLATPKASKVRNFEAMLRVPGDLGVRLGELLALYREDIHKDDTGAWVMEIRRTAHEGAVQLGTKTDHGEASPGRTAPVPPGLVALLLAMPRRIDTPLLFPTQHGKVWRESLFYRDVWGPARVAWGRHITPQDCRHSYVTHLRAAGIDPADLAAFTGHTLETANAVYVHSLGQSADALRAVIG